MERDGKEGEAEKYDGVMLSNWVRRWNWILLKGEFSEQMRKKNNSLSQIILQPLN